MDKFCCDSFTVMYHVVMGYHKVIDNMIDNTVFNKYVIGSVNMY